MSYLNVPRIHFSGQFLADPSTVNNNDSNYDPTVQLSNEQPDATLSINNTSVYWNPNGTHNWKFVNCTVQGAASDQGPFNAANNATNDPIIGAAVLSVGRYPAKIVDLDPDNQAVSQIFGLQVQISIPNPADATKPLATVTGTMPPTAFCDLWNRVTNAPAPANGTMSAAFQAELQNVTWVNPTATTSPLLTALQALSPNALSIRFVVDSYQSDSNQGNFTYGRIVGTIGPVLPGDAPRSTPRRLAPVFQGAPSIMSAYGPAGAAWDANRNVLILDIGNTVPTNLPSSTTTMPSVPAAGWPFQFPSPQPTPPPTPTPPTAPYFAYQLTISNPVAAQPTPTTVGTVYFTAATYTDFAGIVEISVPPTELAPGAPPSTTMVNGVVTETPTSLATLLQQQPMTLTDVTIPATSTTPAPVAAQEDALGRYVDVSIPFARLNPGEATTITLWATLFGQPWNQEGLTLDVHVNPPANASNGPTQPPYLWQNSTPPQALGLSAGGCPYPQASILVPVSNGKGHLTLTARDPGTPRTYPDGQAGPDGQVYWVTGSWAAWGQIFLFPGAPINLLVFSGHACPDTPTWTRDVGPILSNYARMYPYMMSIIDLGDYPTVKENAAAIQRVLNLAVSNPHHMPIERDLSRDKLAMINRWFALGMPQ